MAKKSIALKLYEGRKELGFLKGISVFNMNIVPTADENNAKIFKTEDDAKSYMNIIRIMSKKKIEACITT